MKAIYKCRLCGEVYQNGAHADKEVAGLLMVELNVGLVTPRAPTMTETHTCGGDHAGSLGLADFLGFQGEGAE